MFKFFVLFLHTVIWYQVFLSNTNNLLIIVWFQVFLSNTNNLLIIVWFQVFLSNTNNLLIIVWFQVFLSNTNNLFIIVWFQVFLSNTNNLLIIVGFQVFLILIIWKQNYLADSRGPQQLLPLVVRVDLRVMATNRSSTLRRAPKLPSQHQMKFSVIPRILYRGYSQRILCLTNKATKTFVIVSN